MKELLDIYFLSGQEIGTSGGKQLLRKIQKGLVRALRLSLWVRGKEIDLAIGFGSRPLALCCGLLRIPNATVIDYEHVSLSALKQFCSWIFVPDDVDASFWQARDVRVEKLVRFHGLKEDVYACEHRFDISLRSRLGISQEKIVAVIRPPAHLAHYHDARSEAILREIFKLVAANRSVLALVVSRVRGQRDKSFLHNPNVQVLSRAVNGLDLVGLADLVISGGGTMVREAAALGVPAYSFFTGPMGAIDARLAREGKLVLIRDPSQVSEISFRPNQAEPAHLLGDSSALDFFVDQFIRVGRNGRRA
jgi:predicted glycosyltransferase